MKNLEKYLSILNEEVDGLLLTSRYSRHYGAEFDIAEGVAIVTEQETVLWEGSDYREIEVIAQSCIAPDFIATQDMTLNLLHKRDESFARTPKSLRVEPREDGLHFEADAPECDLGKRALALTANGTYTGCSFEFYPKEYEIEEREVNGKIDTKVIHKSFESIGAFTLAMDPAYLQTSCSVRELHEKTPGAIEAKKREEQAKRDAEEKALEDAAQRARELQLMRMRMKFNF